MLLHTDTPVHAHEWELRTEDYEDFRSVRVFECLECDAVEVR